MKFLNVIAQLLIGLTWFTKYKFSFRKLDNFHNTAQGIISEMTIVSLQSMSLHSAAVERMLRMISVRPRRIADLKLETLSFKASSSSIMFSDCFKAVYQPKFNIHVSLKKNINV